MAQGFHTGGMPTALLGVGKGLVGLALRPTFGILEMTSKASYGMGLVCLGRCSSLTAWPPCWHRLMSSICVCAVADARPS